MVSEGRAEGEGEGEVQCTVIVVVERRGRIFPGFISPSVGISTFTVPIPWPRIRRNARANCPAESAV